MSKSRMAGAHTELLKIQPYCLFQLQTYPFLSMSSVPKEGPPQHRDRCTPPQLLPPPHNPLGVGVEVETHQTLAHPQAVGGEEYLKLKRNNNTTMKMSLQPW